MAAARRQAGQQAMKAAKREIRAVTADRRAALRVATLGCLTALLVAACGGGSGSSSATAPGCLPTHVNQSAALTGVPVEVSPGPGTGSADPHTQVSFLGVPAAQIRDVTVTATQSGKHAGRLEAYSQGDGASFVPDQPFDPGERVAVHAVIGPATAGKPVSFAFHVDTPFSTAGISDFKNPQAPSTDYQTFATLPGVQAPILTVSVPDRDPAAGDIFTETSSGPGRYGPVIYTPQGQLVWFDQLSGGLNAEDLNVQEYDGQRDLTFWEGNVLSLGYGQGNDIVMNSAYRTVATVQAGNGLRADLHEFQIEPDGVAYITAVNAVRCNLASAGGSADGVILDSTLEAIDMKTGLVRWQWHSLDHVPADQSETSPSPNSPWDWFHLNSIDLEPGGDVFISARNTWAGYQLQAGTGVIAWRLGGLKSSFSMGPGTKTFWQHDGRILPDGDVTFFDDGSSPPEEFQSRAVRIALNFSTHAATLVSAIDHPAPPILSASQGNMQTLADGNTVVDYGGIPQISEYSPTGALLFDAHLAYDLTSYRGYRYAWRAIPASPPVVDAHLDHTSLETVLHMSWNGATGLASWRVLAGSGSDTLTPQTAVPSSGFETSTILPKNYAYIEVQALNATGQVLGTSHPVAVASYDTAFPAATSAGGK
jgi:hypothetical protein